MRQDASLSYEVPDHWLTEEKLQRAIPNYRARLKNPKTRKQTTDAMTNLYRMANFGDFLPRLASAFGDRIAMREGRYVPGKTPTPYPALALSYRGLAEHARDRAEELLCTGIHPHQRVGLIAENSPQSVIEKYALLTRGAVAVPWTEKDVDAGMTIAEAMDQAGVFAIAVQSARAVEQLLKEKKKTTPVGYAIENRRIFPIGDEAKDIIQHDIGLPMDVPSSSSLRDVASSIGLEDPAMIFFSSATGASTAKRIVIPHRVLIHHALTAPAMLRQPIGGRCLNVLPQHHIFGSTSRDALYSAGADISETTFWNLETTDGVLLKDLFFHFFCAVPEMFQKIRRKMTRGLQQFADGNGPPLIGPEGAIDGSPILAAIAPFYRRFPILRQSIEWARREIARIALLSLPEQMRRVAREDLSRLCDLERAEDLVAEATEYWGPVLEPSDEEGSIPEGWERYFPRFFREFLARAGYAVALSKAGLGELRFAISGGGALPAREAAYFRAVGKPLFKGGEEKAIIIQGLGSTECPFETIGDPRGESSAMGVGSITPGNALFNEKDEEGNSEILVAGPGVGFYEDSELNQTHFRDGALCTGDIGAVVPVHGREEVFLRGRRKRLIKPRDGTSIMPEPYENALRSSDLIREAYICGEGRPHLGVLIALADDTREDGDDLQKRVREEIERLTGRDRMRQRTGIKRFRIVPGFPEHLYSRSRKLRPQMVEEYFRNDIAALFPKEE